MRCCDVSNQMSRPIIPGAHSFGGGDLRTRGGGVYHSLLATLTVKSQRTNTSGFVGHMVYDPTTLLCPLRLESSQRQSKQMGLLRDVPSKKHDKARWQSLPALFCSPNYRFPPRLSSMCLAPGLRYPFVCGLCCHWGFGLWVLM